MHVQLCYLVVCAGALLALDAKMRVHGPDSFVSCQQGYCFRMHVYVRILRPSCHG